MSGRIQTRGQILAAAVSQAGGLRYDIEQCLQPWLMQCARFAFSNRQNLLCGCYSDDNMNLLELKTLVSNLESAAPWN
jgi:hypothetical protein